MFLLPNPVIILTSQVPLLTPRDWPGSRISMKLFVVSVHQPWQVMRQFSQPIYIENGLENTHIDQLATWYAVPAETLLDWDTPDPNIPIESLVASSISDGKPVSRLFCSGLVESYQPRTCSYDAYWGHWMVQVSFWSQDAEDLPILKIQTITGIVDQHLMNAPDEPCFWILCTGSR